MNPEQYYLLTWRQFILLKEGRERTARQKETDNWQRTRLIAYMTGKPYFSKLYQNMTVYEFMPLPGDPTREEIIEIKKQQQQQEAAEALKVIAMYEEMGLIGKRAIKN